MSKFSKAFFVDCLSFELDKHRQQLTGLFSGPHGAGIAHPSQGRSVNVITGKRQLSQEDQQNVGAHPCSGKLPADYTVRAADAEDLNGIVAVLEPYVQNEVLLRRSETEISDLIGTGFVAVHQSKSGPVIVGFCSVEIYSKKLAEILCLAVDGRHQGHGIGGLLVQECIALAKAKGVMEVMAISSSEQFLHSLGFDYTLPHQKRALFYPLRDRAEFNDLK